MKAYNFFKFLKDQKGKDFPLLHKLLHAPETITKDDLVVNGNLYISASEIEALPPNLQVKGTLYMEFTPITSLPANLKVGKSLLARGSRISSIPEDLQVGQNLYLEATPLGQTYFFPRRIRKKIEDRGGYVKGKIYI